MTSPRDIWVGVAIAVGGLAGCQVTEEPAIGSLPASAVRDEMPAAGDSSPGAGGMEPGRPAPPVWMDGEVVEAGDGSEAPARPLAVTPWVACGSLGEIDTIACQLPAYPSRDYEYAVSYNSREPLPVVCTYWNRGVRMYNKIPYLVFSDNPTAGMRHGGFIFYTGTDATDDDTCAAGQWRHRYWYLDADNTVTTLASNGCYGSNLTLFCRFR